MFSYCSSIIELDLSGWDTSNVTDMSYMFLYSSKLKELDISGWDTSNVKNMKSMFANC
jgi:surface protein